MNTREAIGGTVAVSVLTLVVAVLILFPWVAVVSSGLVIWGTVFYAGVLTVRDWPR